MRGSAPKRRARSRALRPVRDAVSGEEQGRWLAKNEQAIEDYNDFVERYGAFGDEHRRF